MQEKPDLKEEIIEELKERVSGDSKFISTKELKEELKIE